MLTGFKQYSVLNEAAPARGIQHIKHPREDALGKQVTDVHGKQTYIHGPAAINPTLSAIQGAASGRIPVSRKIDDRMSFQAIRTPEGKVGVKYKGPGATYNFSKADIEKQYKEKPYIAGPMHALLQHVHKVLPDKAGEYQGGYLSSPADRTEEDGKITHTPNTIKYAVDKNSKEGRKLAGSKLSIAMHTQIDKNGRAKPLNYEDLKQHPDVHVMSHNVSKEEQNIDPDKKRQALKHIGSAKELMKGQDFSHLAGHEETLRRYTNSTIDTGEAPSVSGYKQFLNNYHNKRIDSVKTEKAKNQKMQEKEDALHHVESNKDAFNRTLQIHHHIQRATYAVADGLSKSAHGGYEHSIEGTPSSGEGFVARDSKGDILKFVPKAFTAANRARTARFKQQKSVI
jgi:hypothetical protein